jgi:2-C-methyl-D-erythritol 4-phosphate cytidylyltransferase
MPRHYAIVPAAGSGVRFGAEVPKQYLPLAGRPLIYHALAALCRCPRIDRVWVVLAGDDAYWTGYDWESLGPKLHALFCGGDCRSTTVGNALAKVGRLIAEDDWVLVHDAVRPCISQEMLNALCDELADDAIGGLLAVPVADTLKRADAAQRVGATEPRDGLWQAQTPQMFRHGVLRQALAAASESPALALTDEAGAIELSGLKPRLVRCDATNLKVTYPADLRLAELVLHGRNE